VFVWDLTPSLPAPRLIGVLPGFSGFLDDFTLTADGRALVGCDWPGMQVIIIITKRKKKEERNKKTEAKPKKRTWQLIGTSIMVQGKTVSVFLCFFLFPFLLKIGILCFFPPRSDADCRVCCAASQRDNDAHNASAAECWPANPHLSPLGPG
jgi:hypothetical protein